MRHVSTAGSAIWKGVLAFLLAACSDGATFDARAVYTIDLRMSTW